ncbi:MAG: putative porin [Lacunisphaera sp.]
MMLRNIPAVAGDAANGGNQNGQINQYQYFGLAAKFRPLVGDIRLEFNHWEPFQIALTGEYAKNLAFDETAIAAIAVNNRGAVSATDPLGVFVGRDTAWNAYLTVGDAALQKRWDWNVSLGYRDVGSDALIDGFVDSDFGGGGTNVKGMTFIGNLALSSRVWLGLRWMSAREVAGPQMKSDVFQFDVNGKF